MNRTECARVLGTHAGASDQELLTRLRDEMRLWTQRANAPTVERRTLAAQRLQELSRVREALGFEPGASAASGGRPGGPTRPPPAPRPAPPPPSSPSGWPPASSPNGSPPASSWPPPPASQGWPPSQSGPAWPSGPPAPFVFPPTTWRRSGTSPSGSAWASSPASPYDFPGIAPASLGQRFGAVLVDALAWVPLALIGAALSDLAIILIIAYLALLAYAEGKIGQSPGKYAMGVRVLGWDDGLPVGVGRAIWRMVCRSLGASFYLLGWAVALFNPGRRAGHDFLAVSVVVTCPPAPKSLDRYIEELSNAI